MTLNKTELRKQNKEKLLSLDLDKISSQICKKVLLLPEFQLSEKILFYWPLKDEINIKPLIYSAIGQGKQCYLPKFCSQESATFSLFKEPSDLIQSAAFKCYESVRSGATETDFEQLELVVIPALAFDRKGFRLGRGKGFYDGLLTKINYARKVGFIPEELVLDCLPVDIWDIPVNYLVTEQGFKEVS